MEEEKFSNSHELMEICYDKLEDLDVNNNSIDDEIDSEKTSEIDANHESMLIDELNIDGYLSDECSDEEEKSLIIQIAISGKKT